MTAKKKTVKQYIKCGNCDNTTFYRYTEHADVVRLYQEPASKGRAAHVAWKKVSGGETEEKDIRCVECDEEFG